MSDTDKPLTQETRVDLPLPVEVVSRLMLAIDREFPDAKMLPGDGSAALRCLVVYGERDWCYYGFTPGEDGFPEILARRRSELGVTQAQLGERVGRSESWVSQVERGERAVDRLSVLARLAAALDLHPAHLLPREFKLDR